MSREKIIEVMKGPETDFANDRRMKLALTALEAAGFAIVPVEPTPRMLHEGEGLTDLILPEGFFNTREARQNEIKTAWRAMIQSAKGE